MGNEAEPLIINGWRIYAHSLFLDQLDALVRGVEAARERDPANYVKKNAAKLHAAIMKLAFEMIPQDPTRPTYRQGNTLGPRHKHWRRAKFFQQYRLFFRYSTTDKTIILVWVNDQDTKRRYGSRNDAYKVFVKMLGAGNLPDSWDDLVRVTKGSTSRLRRTAVSREK